MPNFLGAWAIRGRNSALHIRALKRRALFARGFTLIELVVVTAIIALITGLILASNSAFGGQILLENLAYDIALSIRQAQVYGTAVQRFDINSNTSTFTAGYGVHFDIANPTNYQTFADASCANGLYDNGTNVNCPNDEMSQLTQIDRAFRISKLCAPAGTDSGTCTSVNTLDLLFIRPNPDASISANGQSCKLGSGTCYPSARVVIQSPRNDLDSIVINANGQITVQKN